MMEKPAPQNTFHATTELLLAIRSGRSRYKSLSNEIHYEIAWFAEEADLKGCPIDLSGLAHVTGHSRNTINKQVKFLEDLGYLKTCADNLDSRRKLIYPTPKLKQELKEFAESLSSAITKTSYKIQQSAWSKWAKNTK